MTISRFNEKRPRLGAGAFVHDLALAVGDVTLGEESSLWPGVVARGDVHFIRIGRRSNVQDGAVLHVTQPETAGEDGYPLIIGDDVTIGHRAVVHGCTVGNRVLIGIGAIVLDGAVIEDDVVIGAGSVVAPGKRLESGYLYLGTPARRARPLSDTDRRSIALGARHYVDLKTHYQTDGNDYSY